MDFKTQLTDYQELVLRDTAGHEVGLRHDSQYWKTVDDLIENGCLEEMFDGVLGKIVDISSKGEEYLRRTKAW